jgi:ATP synthase I chain
MTHEAPASADDFYARTIERVQRVMIVIGIAAWVTAQAYFGWRISLGVVLGCTIGYVNFHWLKSVVAGLADLTVRSGNPASTRGIVYRFLLRYFLMAIVGFAILTVSPESLYGFFAGLLVTVAALLCEAAYEAYAALVRRTDIP